MTNKHQYGAEQLTKIVLSAVGLAVAYLLIIAMNNILYEDTLSWHFMVYCSLYGSPFIIVAGIFCQWFVRQCNRLEWCRRHDRLTFIGQMVISVAVAVDLTMLAFVIFDPKPHDSFAEQARELYFRISMIAVTLESILILFLSKYVDQLEYTRAKELELEENELRLTEMRYRQLKAQVNPHFLFNSLNVLASLISIDPARARQYTGQLASIYRYLLTQDADILTTLRDELDFCNQYAAIMSVRFESGLKIRLPRLTDATVGNLRIVPTAIQILIENACKHNMLSAEHPLVVDVRVDGGYVEVTNNISLRPRPSDSTGLGLSGLISKYEMITRRRVITEQTAERFTVRVPLLTADECRHLFVLNPDKQ